MSKRLIKKTKNSSLEEIKRKEGKVEAFNWTLFWWLCGGVYVMCGLFVFALGLFEENSLEGCTPFLFIRALLFFAFLANLYFIYFIAKTMLERRANVKKQENPTRFDIVCLEATGKKFESLNNDQQETFNIFYCAFGYRDLDEHTFQRNFDGIKEEYEDFLYK